MKPLVYSHRTALLTLCSPDISFNPNKDTELILKLTNNLNEFASLSVVSRLVKSISQIDSNS